MPCGRRALGIDAQGECLHPSENHRVEPLEPILRDRKLNRLPAPEHCRNRDLAFLARERKTEADVHAEAERELRHAVALNATTGAWIAWNPKNPSLTLPVSNKP